MLTSLFVIDVFGNNHGTIIASLGWVFPDCTAIQNGNKIHVRVPDDLSAAFIDWCSRQEQAITKVSLTPED